MSHVITSDALVVASRNHVQKQIVEMLQINNQDISKPWLYFMEWLALVAPHMVNVLARLSEEQRLTTLKEAVEKGIYLYVPTEMQFDPTIRAQLHERFMPSSADKPLPVEIQTLIDDIESLYRLLDTEGFTSDVNRQYNVIQMRWHHFKLQAHALIGSGNQPNNAHEYYHVVMPHWRKLLRAVNACV